MFQIRINTFTFKKSKKVLLTIKPNLNPNIIILPICYRAVRSRSTFIMMFGNEEILHIIGEINKNFPNLSIEIWKIKTYPSDLESFRYSSSINKKLLKLLS